MRKLIVIAMALSMMLPLPIMAQEEMNQELSHQNIQSEPMTLESDEYRDLRCTFRITLENGQELESYFYKHKIDPEAKFPLAPKDYVHLINSNILERYDFSILENYDFSDLPNLKETDFTTDINKKIDIKGVRPTTTSPLTQLDSNLPILFQATYDNREANELFQTTFPSSKISISLKDTVLTIDEQQFNTEYIKYSTEPREQFLCLSDKTLSSENIVPIKNGNETIAYLIKVSLRNKTYNEFPDLPITLDFGENGVQNYGLKFLVPLKTLFPQEQTAYPITSEVINRVNEYLKTNLEDCNYGLYKNNYGVTLSIPNSSSTQAEFSFRQDYIKIDGSVEITLNPESYVGFYLEVEGGSDTQNEQLANYWNTTQLKYLDFPLSTQKLQEMANSMHSNLSYEVLDNFSISLKNSYSLKEDGNMSGEIMFPIKVKGLSVEKRNNTLTSFEFWDSTLKVSLGRSQERPWKEWFAQPEEAGEILTKDNINQDYLNSALPDGFVLNDPNFTISFWDNISSPSLDVKSTKPYSLNDVDILDWNELDSQGNPFLWLKYGEAVLYKGHNYTITYTKNSDGTITCVFTGINGLSGKKEYTYIPSTQELPSYIQFIDATNQQVVGEPIFLSSGAIYANVSTYLDKISTNYVCVNKPTYLAAHDFVTGNINGEKAQIAKVKVISASNCTWTPEKDAKILIPYEDSSSSKIKGTMFFNLGDLDPLDPKVTKDKINDALIGYKVLDSEFISNDLELQSNNFKITGYATRDGANPNSYIYHAQEYRLKSLVNITPDSSYNQATLLQVAISIGDFNTQVSVEIPNNSSSGNGSSSLPQITPQNLATALENVINTLAKSFLKKIDSSKPNAGGSSSNSGTGSASQSLPNYTFEISTPVQNIVTKKVDLTATSENGEKNVPTIGVKVKPESHIRLHFYGKRSSESALYDGEMESAMVANSISNDVMEMSEQYEDQIISQSEIVPVSAVTQGNQLTAQSLSNYLREDNLSVPTSFNAIDFNQALDLSMIDTESGYIEIPIPVQEGATPATTTTYVRPKPKPQKPKPEEPAVQDPATSITSSKGRKTMFRLFNRLTGEHFYTASVEEKNTLMATQEWNDEGQGWISPESSSYPVYRVFNPNSGEHHYTMDKNEYETLVSLGWNNEGLGWYSADDLENKIPLYRLYNPTAPEHAKHHYTTSLEERDHLLNTGEWNDEGIGWYGMPTE